LALRDILRLMERTLRDKIEPYSVNAGMWMFFRALWQRDGTTQRELSRRVGIKESSTVVALARMEEKGFIQREREASDRRRIKVKLSQTGRDLEGVLRPLAREMRESTYRGFSPEEMSTLLELLRRMRANLVAQVGEEAASEVTSDYSRS
jgi:DNA-binding MarR family transcriptional regulator